MQFLERSCFTPRPCLLSKTPVATQFVTEANGQKVELVDRRRGKNRDDGWWVSLSLKEQPPVSRAGSCQVLVAF